MPGLRQGLIENSPIALTVGLYWGTALFVADRYGLPNRLLPNLMGYAIPLFIPLVFALCWHAISVMVFVRPDRLTRYLVSDIREFLTWRRVLHAAPVVLLIPVFATAFTFFKSAIPVFEPYSWDATLSEWDRLLHGGIYPWVWLQPVFGYPLVTSAVNFFYNLWFFIMYAMLTLQAFAMRDRNLRMRFLMSFLVTWILLGTLGAIYFSSMGPCYYPTLIQESGPYAQLMHYLKDTNEVVPVWALNVQQLLWDNYQNNRAGIGSGISAMPSMHVATAVLLALLGWRYGKAAGVALSLYALLIMIGSVHLGWHYALDGYAGALGAVLVWWLVGIILDRTRRWGRGRASRTRSPEEQSADLPMPRAAGAETG